MNNKCARIVPGSGHTGRKAAETCTRYAMQILEESRKCAGYRAGRLVWDQRVVGSNPIAPTISTVISGDCSKINSARIRALLALFLILIVLFLSSGCTYQERVVIEHAPIEYEVLTSTNEGLADLDWYY